MTMISEKLANKETWLEFLKSKTDGGHLTRYEELDLTAFIENEEYKDAVASVLSGKELPLPRVREINKKATSKKRVVFVYRRAENYVLKLIAHLLFKYDDLFADNLYSFRKNINVKLAFSRLTSVPNISKYYSYKVDIKDYFNSIDPDSASALVENTITDDPVLKNLIISILKEPCVIQNGKKKVMRKGIMAGVPISGFLANLYLTALDKYFEGLGILYARYSDDIIVFAKTEEELREYEQKIKDTLAEKNLAVNPKKEVRTVPGEKWEFLGFSYHNGTVDISDIAFQKIKNKIRRKARAFVRWKGEKQVEGEKAVKGYIKMLNRKFYDNKNDNDMTWCRWYFPTINTAERLEFLDKYIVENIRFIITGRRTKANYNLRYERIKELGYISLVNSYYRFKKTGEYMPKDQPEE